MFVMVQVPAGSSSFLKLCARLTRSHGLGPGSGIELLTQLVHRPLQLQVAVFQQFVFVHLQPGP